MLTMFAVTVTLVVITVVVRVVVRVISCGSEGVVGGDGVGSVGHEGSGWW